jgi:hypothetical protein
MRVTRAGRKATLSVQWSTAIFADFATPEDDPDAEDPDVWSVREIEIPTSLAAHPYFQVPYFPESGELVEDEIARADLAIKRGRAYAAAGVYADYVKRYYALRMAGVEEWPQYGVEVSRRYKVTQLADAVASTANVGLVLQAANVGMPADVLAVINNLPKIVAYENANPDTYQLERNKFEFVVRPPAISYSVNNGNPVFDITATFLGVQQWSKVIYPGGTWDPDGVT